MGKGLGMPGGDAGLLGSLERQIPEGVMRARQWNSEGARMPATIRLLATDLDGTLIGSANELPLYLTFNDRIDSMRSKNDTKWVACTGRTFRSFWEFFMPMRKYGVVPEYVIIRHAFIFRLTPLGYIPHLAWNIRTMCRIWRETRATTAAIHAWHTTVVGGANGVRTISQSSGALAVRFDSEEAAAVAEDMLRLRQKEHRHMRVIRNKTDVEVRLVPATKGTAVAELSSRLGVSRDEVLAVGNGLNDISMLDGSVSSMIGCPNNSVYEVMTLVSECKGHVASQRSLSGVIEIVDAYLTGNVYSDLPEDLQEPDHRIKTSTRRHQSKNSRRGFGKRHIVIGLCTLYGSLLAFATFDVLPYSNLIRKPMEMLIDGFVKLFSFL